MASSSLISSTVAPEEAAAGLGAYFFSCFFAFKASSLSFWSLNIYMCLFIESTTVFADLSSAAKKSVFLLIKLKRASKKLSIPWAC
jgi:hypothetical protein